MTSGSIRATIEEKKGVKTMNGAYSAVNLPLGEEYINQSEFFEELIDATARLEVFKEKINECIK